MHLAGHSLLQDRWPVRRSGQGWDRRAGVLLTERPPPAAWARPCSPPLTPICTWGHWGDTLSPGSPQAVGRPLGACLLRDMRARTASLCYPLSLPVSHRPRSRTPGVPDPKRGCKIANQRHRFEVWPIHGPACLHLARRRRGQQNRNRARSHKG